MVAIADSAGAAELGQQLAERSLAGSERRVPEVEAVEIQKVKGIERHVAAAALKRVDQRSEARDAGCRLHHHLAVDDRDLHRHLGERLGNGGEPLGPVEALPAEERDAAIFQARLDAIAVMLDLVQPVAARRRLLRRCRQRGLDEARHGAGLGLRHRRGIDDGLASAAFLLRLGDLALARRPHTILLAGDRLDGAPRRGRMRPIDEDVRRIGRAGRLIVRLEQQPGFLLLARLGRHAHEMPAALQLLAAQLEFEMSLAVAEGGIELGRPGALVPDHDGAAAILARRDDALETAILQRMILDMDGKPLLAGDQARAFRHRPALQHTIDLETEIVVQAAGGVLLDDVGIACLRSTFAGRRFGRLREVALGVIGVQGLGHGDKVGEAPSGFHSARRRFMCRNIRNLYNFKPPATDEEIRASSLQFVRKLSGFNRPSKANEAAFDRAVDEVADAARTLLAALATASPPRSREAEAEKARERARTRFA